MSDTLDQWQYFTSPVYSIDKPEFLGDVLAASNDALRKARKDKKPDDIYPVTMSAFDNEDRITAFWDYTVNTGWNLLRDQGYAMEGLETYFTEFWCQQHDKYSSMEYHLHGDCKLVAFYFLECPKDPPRLVIHDPRPGKIMSPLKEADASAVSLASNAINFVPKPGTLMFANAWLPHSFTRNASAKPFKFLHMNLDTRPSTPRVCHPPTAEII
jgi:hypothetical protein